MTDDLKTLPGRISHQMKKLGMRQHDLADKSGVTQATISRILRGETARSRNLKVIAKALNVSEQWLLFGDVSNCERIDSDVTTWTSEEDLPDDMIQVPFFNDMSLSAGLGSINSDIPYSGEHLWYSRSYIKQIATCPDAVFCIAVKGDSMSPVFQENGVVMIDSLDKAIVDGKPYAVTYKGEDYLKYLRRGPDNTVLLVSENTGYPTFTVDFEKLIIIGRVIEYSKTWC